jgi:hypothetical protein
MTTARDVIKKYLSDRHIDYGRGAAAEADGIIAALLSAGYEVLPRAHLNAYEAAAKALPKVYGDAGGEEWNEAFRALAALRAAGIQIEGEEK